MIYNQILTNSILFIIGIFGIIVSILWFNRSVLIPLMFIELVLLSVNLNFITFSVYLDDFYGQIFALYVLSIAAGESSVGLAILIGYYRIRGTIFLKSNIISG